MAMAVTQIATATAALTWMFVEWAIKGKPSVLGIISGAIAGLVAITPASGFVDPRGALIIGIVAGVACYWGATWLKNTLGYDDSLDAFGVHGVGGAAARKHCAAARSTYAHLPPFCARCDLFAKPDLGIGFTAPSPFFRPTSRNKLEVDPAEPHPVAVGALKS